MNENSKKLILHIGAAKTGTSAIQEFIRRNRFPLRKNGIIIPDRNLALTDDVSGEHVWACQDFMRKGGSGLVDRLLELSDFVCEGETVLISAENLSNLGCHEYFIYDKLVKEYDVKVILYIRRQDELLTSAWQQWHAKVEEDLNAWLLRAVKSYGQWWQLINDWECVVGKGKVDVRIFERDAFVEGSLTKDFASALGISDYLDLEFDIGIVNPTYLDYIVPLVAGNKNVFSDANDNKYYNFIRKITGDRYIGGGKISLISRRQRDEIVAYYSDINKKVCKKYFPGRGRLFSSVDHSKYEYLSEMQMLERQVRFLAEVVYKIATDD